MAFVRLLSLALLLLAAVFAAPGAHAEPFVTPHVTLDLVSSRAKIAPGESFDVVLRQKMAPGWHVYWVNPGDSGERTQVVWTLPPGFKAGELIWPIPKRKATGPILDYVLEGQALYPVRISAPADLQPGPVDLAVKAAWLVCEEICIPEEGEVRVRVEAAAASAPDPEGARLLEAARRAIPAPLAAVAARKAGEVVQVEVKAAANEALGAALAAGKVKSAEYYPYGRSLIDHAAPQNPKIGRDGVAFSIPVSLSYDASSKPDGLIVAEIDGVRRGFATEAPILEAASAAPPPAASTAPSAPAPGALGFAGAIVLAFLGGIVLNAMPCVFPMLALKALGIAQTAHGGAARRHGLFFLVGVLATFLLLAGVLIALQAGGAAIGWGFQLQDPFVIAALATLFFLIALNMAGVFEVGGGQGIGQKLADRGGDAGAFFTGALAVLAASPCTAPFMAGALGWAATQPPRIALLVFAFLGLGFAAPFTLLSFAPQLRKLLPKPGLWMETFKQFLAFPMLAATAWLVWVLAEQAGAMGVAAILAWFVAMAFALWTLRNAIPWRIAALVVLTSTALGGVGALRASAPTQVAMSVGEEAWSEARLAALRAEGRPVLVNFTAAWCVSCKANEITTLSTPRVRAALAEKGVVYLKGDWTRRDQAITQALAAHGRAGVPLYLFYPGGGGEPRVLPQLLTPNLVIEAVGKS
jgi:thiol:disulfide interchange protein DsbD